MQKTEIHSPEGAQPDSNKIPIFVIVKDRLEVLKQSLESFKQIKTPHEIVLIDNGTTFSPTLSFLAEFEDAVYYIGRGTPYNKTTFCHEPSKIIEQHVRKTGAKYYVVTDPDIELCKMSGNILEAFVTLLDMTDVICVGPSLMLDDIPSHYPLKQEVFKRQKQFWEPPLDCFTFNGEIIAFKYALIDTTFALYRATFRFRRHNKGIRVFHPYVARHLDWYIDPENMTLDQIYYTETHKGISHWCGKNLHPAL